MEKIYEVIRLKQEQRLVPKKIRELIEGHDVIRSPEALKEFAQRLIGDEDREVFLIIGLNTKNKVQFVQRAHIGTVNASLVHPREVMKGLIINNCASFIATHCHPSGSLKPSSEDFEVTEALKQVGDLMKIQLLDHVIVTTTDYLSFQEKGYL